MDDGREVGDGCRELDLVVETAVASACRRGGACRVARHEENLLQGWTACLAGVVLPPWRRSRKWRRSRGRQVEADGRCGPSFHLLQQQVYLLGLDPTAAAALQIKVATTKVQAECR